MNKEDTILFIISGKARHGKDTTADIIKDYYEEKKKKIIGLHYVSCLKEYAKKISGWDGSDDTKPRSLLQELSTDIIRKQINQDFFIERTIQDIKVYSYYFDVITIADTRLKVEIEKTKPTIKNTITIRINRPNFDNGLTLEQKNHITEVDLDDYDKFDYKIENDGTIEDLRKKIYEILDEVEK